MTSQPENTTYPYLLPWVEYLIGIIELFLIRKYIIYHIIGEEGGIILTTVLGFVLGTIHILIT